MCKLKAFVIQKEKERKKIKLNISSKRKGFNKPEIYKNIDFIIIFYLFFFFFLQTSSIIKPKINKKNSYISVKFKGVTSQNFQQI